MAVRKSRKIDLSARCQREVAYWYSIRPGDKFCVGTNEMIVIDMSPHGTHVISAEGKWNPRDVGLHQEATGEIRLRGEEVRKALLKNKPNHDPLVNKRNLKEADK